MVGVSRPRLAARVVLGPGRESESFLSASEVPPVARGSLRRYDVQARWSVICSAIAVIGLLGTAGLLVRNYDAELKMIIFGNSMFQPAVLIGVAGTMGLAAIGALLGLSSAGQRRNEHQGRSWAGFFLGTAVLSLAIITFVAFWLMRSKVG